MDTTPFVSYGILASDFLRTSGATTVRRERLFKWEDRRKAVLSERSTGT